MIQQSTRQRVEVDGTVVMAGEVQYIGNDAQMHRDESSIILVFDSPEDLRAIVRAARAGESFVIRPRSF